MSARSYTISIEFTEDDIRKMRRELNKLMVVVPTISGLIQTIEHTTGVTARSTVIGDMRKAAFKQENEQ